MTKKSKMILALASMLGVSAGATAISGFAWFTTTKQANVDVTNIGVYSTSSALAVSWTEGQTAIGCAQDPGVTTGLGVVGAASSSTLTETITATEATQTVFKVNKHPYSISSISIDDGSTTTAGSGTVTDPVAKTITLSNGVSAGNKVTITYTPYEALTDLSSVNGQEIYKPTWTASGEGRYCTAFTPATTGFVRFKMTLTATGGSDLRVFLNKGASVSPADEHNNDDIYAAHIARVAIIDNTETKFVFQEDKTHGTVGVSSTYTTSAFNHRLAESGANDCWDLKETTTNPLPDLGTNLLSQTAITDKTAHDSAWAANSVNQVAAESFITTVGAGQSKDITVTIWLEGTNYTEDSGTFTNSPENGMIAVNLPLIAF